MRPFKTETFASDAFCRWNMTDTVFDKVTFYLGLACLGTALLISIGQRSHHGFDLGATHQPAAIAQELSD